MGKKILKKSYEINDNEMIKQIFYLELFFTTHSVAFSQLLCNHKRIV